MTDFSDPTLVPMTNYEREQIQFARQCADLQAQKRVNWRLRARRLLGIR